MSRSDDALTLAGSFAAGVLLGVSLTLRVLSLVLRATRRGSSVIVRRAHRTDSS